MITKKSLGVGIASFLIVLFLMPLGHAMMILMQHYMEGSTLNHAAFAMGFVGLIITIIGIFVKGDTKQTLCGLVGGLLFWTGWVEFVYVYYAGALDVQPIPGDPSKPEYLMMPTSFGFLVMFFMAYIFNTKSGCNFFNWIQKHFLKSELRVKIRPSIHNSAMVTFMELNLILWTFYLILMFAYDKNFIGDDSPWIMVIMAICLIGSLYMFFSKLIHITQWGYAIRYSIATVVIFWNVVEILTRREFFKEFWIEPLQYKGEMTAILSSLILLLIVMGINIWYRKKA